MVQVPDEILTFAALEKGPGSKEAVLLAKMWLLRAKDRQVFPFQVGNYLVIGPVPDAMTEMVMIEIAKENEQEHDG